MTPRTVVSRESWDRKEPYAGRIRTYTEHVLTLDCGHRVRTRRWDGCLVREVECPTCERIGAGPMEVTP